MMEMNECLPQSVPRRILLKNQLTNAVIEVKARVLKYSSTSSNAKLDDEIISTVMSARFPRIRISVVSFFFLMRIIIIIFDFWFASSSVTQTNIRPTADTTFSSQYKAMLFKDERLFFKSK